MTAWGADGTAASLVATEQEQKFEVRSAVADCRRLGRETGPRELDTS